MVARWLALVLILGQVSGGIALAAPVGTHAQPAGPLGATLDNFARSSGIDILYPEALVAGKTSPGSGPVATPQAALLQILRGTGLVARFVRADAIVLEQATASEQPKLTLDRMRAPPSPAQRSAYLWYGQQLLDMSLARLRGHSELAGRSYDLMVYLWIDGAGRVTDLKVGDDTVAARETDAIRAALTGLAMKDAPPADMPQPVGLRFASE